MSMSEDKGEKKRTVHHSRSVTKEVGCLEEGISVGREAEDRESDQSHERRDRERK